MRNTTAALHSLHQAIDAPRHSDHHLRTWRWAVRQRMVGVRDQLVLETSHHDEAWLAARGGTVLRERNALLRRIATMGSLVLETDSVEEVHGELRRLLDDIRHHLQRLHDLAYDEVEMELGGSE